MQKAKHCVKIEASNLKLLRNPKREIKAFASQIRASDEMAKLFPSDVSPDILYVSLVCHTMNHINQNDCLILGEEGMSSYKTVLKKPLDVEHERTDIVGFCVNSFLSNMKNNKVLSEDAANEILDNNGMVNVGAIFAVWKINYPEIIELLEENFDENSENFNKVKASFEYYFNEYDFFISNGNADFPNGKIVSGSADNAEFLFSLLRINGGSGKVGSDRISIIPRDGFVGGCALTFAPANEFSDVLGKKDGDEVVKADAEIIESVIEENKTSQSVKIEDKTSVDITGEDMEKTQTPETQAVAAVTAPAVETPAAVVPAPAAPTPVAVVAAIPLPVDKGVADSLQREMDKKIQELDLANNKYSALETQFNELKANFNKVSDLANQLQTKVDGEVEARAAREKEEARKAKEALVASRVAKLSEVFEVNDANKALVEADVASLSEEDFGKKVEFYRSICANKIETTPTASVKTAVEEIVTATAKETPAVDIVAAGTTQTLVDVYKAAFGEPKSLGFKIEK